MDRIEKNAAIGVFLSPSPKSPKGYAPKAFADQDGGKDRRLKTEVGPITSLTTISRDTRDDPRPPLPRSMQAYLRHAHSGPPAAANGSRLPKCSPDPRPGRPTAILEA
jgi:hypothetical protein